MTDDDKDPVLEAAFANSPKALPNDRFALEVVAQTDRLQTRKILVGVFAAVVLFLLGEHMQNVSAAVTEILVMQVVDIPSGWFADFLVPINTVGGVLTIMVILLRAFYRKVFS